MPDFLIVWMVVFWLCKFAQKWLIWALLLLASVVVAAVGWAIFGLGRMPFNILYGAAWGLATQAIVLQLKGKGEMAIRIVGFLGMVLLPIAGFFIVMSGVEIP